MWEHGWLDHDIETFMFKQLTKAFDVDRVIFAPHRLDNRSFPEQYDSVTDAIEDSVGTPVYLIPQHGKALSTLEHPEDAVYVFGNAYQSNFDVARRRGDLIVQIPTPKPVDFFSISAASMVLYDRMTKNERRSKN